TRERIIAAAAKVLAEKGYEATTLREISREAQAGPGLVHYYFGGKDALLVEVLQTAGQQFHQRMEHLIQQVPGDQSLEAFLRNSLTVSGRTWRSTPCAKNRSRLPNTTPPLHLRCANASPSDGRKLALSWLRSWRTCRV